MKMILKRILIVISLVTISVLYSSCYELEYETEDEYFDLFDNDVYLIYSDQEGLDASSDTVSFDKYFYNKEDAEGFNGEHVDNEYYSYLCVKLDSDEDVSFRDFCLFIKSEEQVNLSIRFFISDDYIDYGNMRCYNSPLRKTLPSGKEELIKYKDNYINPIQEVEIGVNESEFSGVSLSEYIINGENKKQFTLKPDQYLIIQFLNNTGYGKDLGLKCVKFTMACLIINRAG